MNPLEKETLKYEKKGYKVEQKRTLKHGLRTFLSKKGGFFGSNEGVYIYYADGDATTDNLRECFKDYMKFYEEKSFDSSDRGLFLCNGNVDEKLFRDLRKAMIRDDDTRNSIRLVKGCVSAQKKPVEKKIKKGEKSPEKDGPLSHDETERIIHRVGTMCCYPNCKENIALDVHHIVPREDGGTNRDDNLIVLCPVHHRLADRGAIPKKRLEMNNVRRMEDKRL